MASLRHGRFPRPRSQIQATPRRKAPPKGLLNPAMPLLAGRLCSPADRLLAVHRRFAKQKGHGRVSSAMARARAMGNARGWDERERERERAN